MPCEVEHRRLVEARVVEITIRDDQLVVRGFSPRHDPPIGMNDDRPANKRMAVLNARLGHRGDECGVLVSSRLDRQIAVIEPDFRSFFIALRIGRRRV